MWLKASAREDNLPTGSKKAQYLLAIKYKNGDGVKQNNDKAIELIISSAGNGFPNICYKNGYKDSQLIMAKIAYIKKDYTTYMRYLITSSHDYGEKGNKEAKKILLGHLKNNDEILKFADPNRIDKIHKKLIAKSTRQELKRQKNLDQDSYSTTYNPAQ